MTRKKELHKHVLAANYLLLPLLIPIHLLDRLTIPCQTQLIVQDSWDYTPVTSLKQVSSGPNMRTRILQVSSYPGMQGWYIDPKSEDSIPLSMVP